MPLLLCPNDNASMTTVNRSGVEFDMCPICRGVWLDRGELEKLIEDGGSQGGQSPTPTTYAMRPPERDHRRDRDDEFGRDEGYRKKKRRDIFDIFD